MVHTRVTFFLLTIQYTGTSVMRLTRTESETYTPRDDMQGSYGIVINVRCDSRNANITLRKRPNHDRCTVLELER